MWFGPESVVALVMDSSQMHGPGSGSHPPGGMPQAGYMEPVPQEHLRSGLSVMGASYGAKRDENRQILSFVDFRRDLNR